MISQLVETENDLSTWWAPNNYGKRLSQLVGRSALDYYYCGNCALLLYYVVHQHFPNGPLQRKG